MYLISSNTVRCPANSANTLKTVAYVVIDIKFLLLFTYGILCGVRTMGKLFTHVNSIIWQQSHGGKAL